MAGEAADAATELGEELSRLGLAAVKGLSDQNLDDLDAATALRVHLDDHDTLVETLSRALALVESVHSAARAGVDTPNVVWNVLKDHAVDPRVLSAFVYHVTTVMTAAPKGGSGDAQAEADNVRKAHAAAALYLALMQLPGARSHLFNEFTFRSVVQSIRFIVVAPQTREYKEKGKKRKARSAAGAGLSRAQRAETREGSRKSARVVGASATSRQHMDDDDDEEADEDMEMDHSDDDANKDFGFLSGNDKSDQGQRSLGMHLMHQAHQLAENLSLQTCPQAHDQLARGAGKTVMKHLLPGVLRPGAPAAAVKGVVAFVDSCLAELPPPSSSASEAQQSIGNAASTSKAPVAGDAAAESAAGDGEAVSAEQSKEGQAPHEDKFEDAVVVLCHQLCVRVGDRAPTRVHVATAVTGLLDALRRRRGGEKAKVYFENMGRFISRLARHAKVYSQYKR